MDLIASLATNLGISPESAQGAVGSLLSLVKQHAPAEAFAEVEAKAPETTGWMAAAAQPTAVAPTGQEGGGGLLGSLLGAVGGLGGSLGALAGPLGSLVSSLSNHGLSSDSLGTLVPLVLQFLHGKIGQEGVAKLLASVPFLSHLAGNAASAQPGGGESALEGALGSALGALFK